MKRNTMIKLSMFALALTLSATFVGCGNTPSESSEIPDRSAAQPAASVMQTMAQTGTRSFEESKSTQKLTLEQAQGIAVQASGAVEPVFLECRYDRDDDCYEFEFIADGTEYEYEVHARDGKLLHTKHQPTVSAHHTEQTICSNPNCTDAVCPVHVKKHTSTHTASSHHADSRSAHHQNHHR